MPRSAEYAAAKARIFARCDTAVINLDDPLVAAMPHQAARVVGFSLHDAPGADYTVAVREGGKPWLMRRGEPLLAVESMRLTGMHNAANALAALALGEAIGLPLQAMLDELRDVSRACRIARSGWPMCAVSATWMTPREPMSAQPSRRSPAWPAP